MPDVRIIGTGRAGQSFAAALDSVGWNVDQVIGRGQSVLGAADGTDLVLICTPDDAIKSVAAAIWLGDAVVAHVAGSLGLTPLEPHERTAAIHPLVSLPDVQRGANRLLDSCWFATDGDPLVEDVVRDLGGRSFQIAESDRAIYHAAACVAANHVVALLGQAERLASGIGVPSGAYADLARSALADVDTLGAPAALTGPVARGDMATIARHRAALPVDELATYDAMVAEAQRLAAERGLQ